MCGIAGILMHERGAACPADAVVAMRDAVRHRGPDEEGLFTDGGVALGHRRLSIIDLTDGRQPLSNEDGSLWIVFNGEIFNYKSLRQELAGKGHRFRTGSDTETILHLYEEAGPDCVNRLNGMFAFAIWDGRAQSLFLARDRMGIKPLYYSMSPSFFAFSSEIKSLFQGGLIEAECDEQSVPEYMLFRYVSGENTLFRGVKSLLPGHTATVRDGRLSTRRYWSPVPRQIDPGMKYADAMEEASALIEDSVRIRLMSDVPLGTFCSGGVDSSLVTSFAARLVGKPINTFSVGFFENDYDETEYAEEVSRLYGTLHHEIRLNNEEFAELLPAMIWHNDEPLNFPNSVLIYAISRLAKKHVTVVLTGEGADELFAGYPRYQVPRFLGAFKSLPAFARRALLAAARLSNDHRVARLRSDSGLPMRDLLIDNAVPLRRDVLESSLPVLRGRAFPYRDEVLGLLERPGLDAGMKAALLDQHTYLVSILNRQDKMSMAASVESRVPFLDYRIVEFANRLPSDFKISGMTGKRIIKDIALRHLPARVIKRRKSGFGVPLCKWFRSSTGLGSMLETLADCPRLSAYMDKAALRRIISEHRGGAADHSEFLWTALNLSLWHRIIEEKFISNRSPYWKEQTASSLR